MEICGVKFSDPKQYEAVKISVDSAIIEGFKPTKESIEHIKSVLNNKTTIKELIESHKGDSFSKTSF